MAKTEQMLRLKYIEQFLRERRHRGASLAEIQDYLERKFAEEDFTLKFTERTFLRDKQALLDIWGIEITYFRGEKVYRISNEELEQDSDHILDNIHIIEAYRKTKDKQDIMLFERRKARGLENFNGFIHAITQRKVVSFEYQKYWQDDKKYRAVEPYALKEFQNRWYLLAKDHQPQDGNSVMKTFGLDRITDLDIKKKTFKREPYNPQEIFQNSFGIIAPNGEKPQEIRLAFDWEQAKYIEALPLHSSQRVVSKTDEETIFSLFLVPTYDFEREILSYGNRVKILEPKSLRDRLKNEVQKMLEHLTNAD